MLERDKNRQMDTSNLITEYRADPQRGFTRIYEAFSDKLATYVRRSFGLSDADVADVVHDAFLPWVEAPERVGSVENLSGYLFSTAKYLAMQKRKQLQAASSDQPEGIEPSSPSHSADIEDVVIVEKALSTLPEEQREAVVLKIWGDLTLEEIAQMQGVSVQTAASRYRYALLKLKEKLSWTD